ncbi:MAG: Hpt domain-containing protein [Hyphomicrobiales bacterium]
MFSPSSRATPEAKHVTAQPEPEAPAVFDRLHFSRQTFDDESLQRELVGLFLAQAEEALRTLALPVTSTAWRFLTHTLKGAALAIGCNRLAAWAARGERSAPPNAAGRLALADELRGEIRAFRAAAAEFLP